MAQKKTSEKKAKKALARAEEAGKDAVKAVKDSSKKLRHRAASLSKKTAKLEAEHAEAARGAKSAAVALDERRRDDIAEEDAEPTDGTAAHGAVAEELTPPLPAPEPAAPTLVELRHRAKEQGVTGYSRMNKAALLAALDAAPAE